MEITKANGVIYFTDGDKSTMIPQAVLQTAVIEKSGGGINIIYNQGGKDTVLNILYTDVTTPVVTSSDTLISELYTLIGQPLDATIIYGTPVNAVAAQGTLTLTAGTGNTILNNKTVTVGGKVYTFKTALTPTEGQVLIGANDTAALLNLLNAINHIGTPNTDYKCAAANAKVTAISSDATTLIVENKIKGVIGNSEPVDTDIAGAWDDTTLGTTVAGVDGTIGALNTIYKYGNSIYFTNGNTIADANWDKYSPPSLSLNGQDLTIDGGNTVTLPNGVPVSPKLYKAILTQSGTNAPVATVLNGNDANFLSGVTFTRDSTGTYYILRTGISSSNTLVHFDRATNKLSTHSLTIGIDNILYEQYELSGGTATKFDVITIGYITIEYYGS